MRLESVFRQWRGMGSTSDEIGKETYIVGTEDGVGH